MLSFRTTIGSKISIEFISMFRSAKKLATTVLAFLMLTSLLNRNEELKIDNRVKTSMYFFITIIFAVIDSKIIKLALTKI